MKTLFFIIFILINTQFLNAQLQGQAKIDSLLKELPKMKEDTNGVNLLSLLSFSYSLLNPNEGIQYGEQGLKLTKKIKWVLGKSKIYNSLGSNYSAKLMHKKALEYFQKALEISEKLENKHEIARNIGNIGASYHQNFEFTKALKYYAKSLKINEELKNKNGISVALSNMGSIYAQQSNYSKALEYFIRALKIDEDLNNLSRVAMNLAGIAFIYQSQSNFPKALEYYQKCLKINEELGDLRGAAYAQSNIGNLYGIDKNYTKALEYYHKAAKVLEQIGDEYGSVAILGNIGNIYMAQSQYSEAMEYFQKSLKICRKFDKKDGIALNLGNLGSLYLKQAEDSTIENSENKMELILNKEVNLNNAIEYSINAINAYKEIGELHSNSKSLAILSNAYKLKGDYKNALKYYKESKKLNDSIFSSENQTKIAKLEAKRENELKEKEILILKKEKENEKIQKYAMFGGIAGLGIIIGLILIQRRKSEKLLLNVLPAKIAKRLKAKEHPIADHFDNASIIFIDLVGFTKMSSSANPKEIVALLNDIFTIFDKLAYKHGLEKIKTIGDAYMAVAGIPEIQADHSKRTALMALDIKQEMKDFKTSDGTEIKFRIGIDCGAVVAGVIGEKKFIYDLWSDAVNTASRMESTGEKGQIQITENFKEELEKYDGDWNFTFRGEFEIKGKGLMKTYYLGN